MSSAYNPEHLPLSPGTRLGVYEITGQLGAGGMGEVYRARDTKLNRDVAIKVLPASFAGDPDRLARFEREAQVLAALNHPNIAHIYGVEGGDTFDSALVMELVEGEDLSAIIARGPMPLADALPIAKQLADALELAHEQGIVHRDLKPANIKVRADGMVKVLDFGLAKAFDPAASSSAEAMNSPTLSVRATQMGMIIGTAAYMAPEQARGKAVDRRADIWAFGVVLYEMLAGQRAFKGEDISVTLAGVIKDEVNWQALPADLPEPIRRLLRRCLEKDPKRRLRDIGEARLTLEEPASSASVSEAGAQAPTLQPPSLWRRALPIVATAVIVGAIAGVLMWRLTPPPAAAPVVTRFPIVLPEDQVITTMGNGAVAVSPDGSRIAYVANSQLYIRSMGEVEARPIPGSRVDPDFPVFSPDGQSVAFHSNGSLLRLPISGGTPLTLCKTGMLWGASWHGDTIVFVSRDRGILRVSASGGEPEEIVKTRGGELAYGPQVLDAGRLLLFTLASATGAERWDNAQVIVQSMATGERHVVVRGGSAARYVFTEPGSPARAGGHVVYAVANSLLAMPFDLTRLEALGSPVPVVEGVARPQNLASGVAQYDVSATGTIAYVSGTTAPGGNEPKSLAFAGRDGKIQPLGLPAQPYVHPRLSPDGRQLVVGTDDGKDAVVWVYDLKAAGSLRRLTFGGRNLFPIWTPDGRFITFQSDRDGDLAVFKQLADGSGPAERLTKPGAVSHEPESWSPDGKTLSLNVITDANPGVWTMGANPDNKPTAFVDTEGVEKHSSFSPDGRWLAHMASVGSGVVEAFIQPFPPTGAKYQVSNGGGRTPLWSPDGKQLFFHVLGPNRIFVVDVNAGQGLTFGTPVPLPIDGTIHPQAQRNYDVTPDGKQLIVVLPAQAAKGAATSAALTQINVVMNWFEELRARAPRK
jgi:eukaryotic-like serine/threonine-protein kinase